ncbi:DUF5665 domain-containing protein [Thalassococcus lentus]|uniref:DUF5665 domain-containing protein n=1 Tax=Thalassococcus lentus TaxID=1210524 RepID=A0ABT4XV04_9RHOB|nr:DUF5665 domain-containing protein [Thalassococcus lentus]MDA7425784.1 DUF5665 domain-containing protein [Thalassococcus lentus]
MTDEQRPQVDVTALTEEVKRFNDHRFVRIHNSVFALMWFQFLRGLAFGLGSVLGATALVSILVLLLGQVEFIPILGEWATRLIDEIQTPQPN